MFEHRRDPAIGSLAAELLHNAYGTPTWMGISFRPEGDGSLLRTVAALPGEGLKRSSAEEARYNQLLGDLRKDLGGRRAAVERPGFSPGSSNSLRNWEWKWSCGEKGPSLPISSSPSAPWETIPPAASLRPCRPFPRRAIPGRWPWRLPGGEGWGGPWKGGELMSVASHCRFDLPCAMVGAVCAIEGFRGAVAVVNGSTACKYLAGRVVEVQDPFGPRLDPRWPGCFGQTRVPCTNIDQEDIIFGMEGKVAAALREVHQRCRPRLIALVNGCAAAAIGEDLTGWPGLEELGCSIIIIDAPGCSDAVIGWQRAIRALVMKMAADGGEGHQHHRLASSTAIG